MGISVYQEVTEWNEPEFVVPNHIYLFDGKSNAIAYAKAVSGEVITFKTPLKIDTRRRKFIKVKHKELEKIAKTIKEEPEPVANNINIFIVASDSGKQYTVELVNGKYSCNCVGFSYRGKCKHSEQVRNEKSQ